VTEFLPLRFARTLCLQPLLLRGEVLFVGDAGSEGATLSELNICVCAGSIDSLALIRRVRVTVLGVIDCSVVFRRFCALELFGAGVKSSSPLPLSTRSLSSSSEHSTTTRRRVAARLAGREGDTVGISEVIVAAAQFSKVVGVVAATL